MNAQGECFPTQRQIAEACGLSKTTVNKAVNELLEFKIDGRPLIQRELVGPNNNSVYTINPISQVAIFSGGIEKIEEKPAKAADKEGLTPGKIINHFFDTFTEVYQVRPSMNYAAATKMIKNSWIGKYTDDQILRMVEISVKEYDKRWKSAKFPRPTLPAIISWIGVQAIGTDEDQQKEYQAIQDMTADTAAVEAYLLKQLKAGD
jgi:DNA-binding Lrp family transcriptional regulator